MTKQFKDITYLGSEIDDLDTYNLLPDYLKDFYLNNNGLIAYNGGLHIRGCANFPEWHSLKEYWFGKMKLSHLFSTININDIPFAQDCFGDQYIIRNNKLGRVLAEIDEFQDLKIVFCEFLHQVTSNVYEFLAIENISQFNLKPNQLINAFPPFCMDIKQRILKPIDLTKRITFLSEFSKQIKNLPDGTNIQFDVK